MPRNRPGAPEDRIRIQHMMDAARQAIGFAQGKSRKSLDTDPMLARALMLSFFMSLIARCLSYSMDPSSTKQQPKHRHF